MPNALQVTVLTSSVAGCGTAGNVCLDLQGDKGSSGVLTLRNKGGSFRPGQVGSGWLCVETHSVGNLTMSLHCLAGHQHKSPSFHLHLCIPTSIPATATWHAVGQLHLPPACPWGAIVTAGGA